MVSFSSTDLVVPACLDRFPLAATWTAPADRTRAVVVIAPAIAVPRQFYGRFAAYLAGRGVASLCFDYRGSGDSGPAWRSDAVGGFTALGERDAAGAIDSALARAAEAGDGVPVGFVGHSLGAMTLGLAPNNDQVARAVSVASGNGTAPTAPAVTGPSSAITSKLSDGMRLPKG